MACRDEAGFFFLQFDGHRRDVPSFPTRRSSDLVGPGRAGRGSAARGRPRRRTRRARPDRKSTRLNSSHTVISYAVFCLKKKKYPTALTRPFTMTFSGASLPTFSASLPV